MNTVGKHVNSVTHRCLVRNEVLRVAFNYPKHEFLLHCCGLQRILDHSINLYRTRLKILNFNVGFCLTPVSGCFTPNFRFETNTSQGKADYTFVSTFFHYVRMFVGYQYTVLCNKDFTIFKMSGMLLNKPTPYTWFQNLFFQTMKNFKNH